MIATDNPWILAAIGGVGIAAATTALLALNGNIAGCGGALARVFHPFRGARGWQAVFVLGIVLGGAVAFMIQPTLFVGSDLPRSRGAIIASGLLMGVGGRMANGCMSGHCICGVSRLAKRSIVATALFMLAAGVTVFAITSFCGGRL